MEDSRKFDISFLGEFKNKAIESEFIEYDMRRYAKVLGPIALIFGTIYMMFLIADYFAIDSPYAFTIILVIRSLFLVVSVVVSLAIKKVNNYINLPYMITAYEILAIIGFVVIIGFYESHTVLLFFSVTVLTLAIYIMPNRPIYSQFIVIFLSMPFFMFHAKNIEGIDTTVFLKIIAYYLIMIIYCSIGAYLTNFYKRKQFLDRRELLRVSVTDPLTGIYNRAKFNEEISQWTDNCNRYENIFSLVMLDIDDFKKINDRYGHIIGDSVIQNLATTIQKVIRHTDILARWGGEEFVILLPNTEINQALEMTERIRICIEKSKYHKVENITCSFGLVAHRKNEDSESLLCRVDKLLYDAKNCGKNVVVSEANKIGERVLEIDFQI
ncbi:GGDEF domain-containing protein [Alkalicella caledoniensis]|uniref:GGDEF domain-containing protein n=1 Tax=Alkalicella caledoniensis TaxID=2731377 RepID=A0A7G9W9K8_ALKCA|nr:GGDEF domain-containing protein [Alkalicella caledoniensis]QNO15370.1 GGDEF domain-containing protein [Alkalicella caledoniensis]